MLCYTRPASLAASHAFEQSFPLYHNTVRTSLCSCPGLTVLSHKVAKPDTYHELLNSLSYLDAAMDRTYSSLTNRVSANEPPTTFGLAAGPPAASVHRIPSQLDTHL